MDQDQPAPVDRVSPVNKPGSVARTLGEFLLHLAAVYLLAKFAVLRLSAQAHNVILPLLRLPSHESRLEFAFNHLLLFSVLCGLVAGFIAFVIEGAHHHRLAQFAWVVPAIILAYKFTTYPASVLENHFAAAFHYYLGSGFLIPDFHSYDAMFTGWSPDYTRGLDQLRFTAPMYIGIAYGFAIWVGSRFGIYLPLPGARKTGRNKPAVSRSEANRYFAGRNSIFTSRRAGLKSKSAVTKTRSVDSAVSSIPNAST